MGCHRLEPPGKPVASDTNEGPMHPFGHASLHKLPQDKVAKGTPPDATLSSWAQQVGVSHHRSPGGWFPLYPAQNWSSFLRPSYLCINCCQRDNEVFCSDEEDRHCFHIALASRTRESNIGNKEPSYFNLEWWDSAEIVAKGWSNSNIYCGWKISLIKGLNFSSILL